MTRFCLNAYVVDDENREALEACRDVARLDTADSRPIILVGGQGSGKTHLLRAIAEEIRESSSRAGIVYVRSDNIPDSVQKLVKDPTPIDLAQQAVLLVDDLHRCAGDIRSLGEIVGIFLENDHRIVFASRESPDRLHSIPPEIENALAKSRVIEIGSGGVQRNIQLIEARILQDTKETITRQEQEIEDLRGRLNTLHPDPGRVQDEEEVGLLRECVEELTVNLSEARQHLADLNMELEELKTRRPVASSPPEEESEPQPDFEEAQKTRREAGLMLERAERLTEQMHKARTEFLRAQDERAHQESEIDELESVYSRSGEDSSQATRQPEDSPGRDSEAELQDELDTLRNGQEAQLREREQLEESIVRAHSERDTMKGLLQRLRNERDEARKDLDRARNESKQQAMAQRAATEKLAALHSQLLEGPVLLERLMELFGLPDSGSEDSIAEDLPPESDSTASTSRREPITDDRGAENSILRPDFGEGARPVVRKSSSLHHVEELSSRLDVETGDATLEDEAQIEPQSRNRSA